MLPTERLTCLVTGAQGFFGRKLVETLLDKGCQVRGFDLLPCSTAERDYTHVRGDLRIPQDVQRACEGVDIVFHTAAIISPNGLLSRARKKELYDVNVSGTYNIIHACQQCGVTKFVYTSSNNVVVDQPIAEGDEKIPYATRFLDHYTRTKVLAEQAVLAADGVRGLSTCALRPGGIYGPGDRVFLPIVMATCKRRIPLWIIGNGTALADQIYVDDLAEAHWLAAERLVRGGIVGGQAYFLSDGLPMNYFEFINRLITKAGFPAIEGRISYPIGYAAGWICEWIDYLFLPCRGLTRAGVRKMAHHNYFSLDKARRELGFEPKISKDEGIARCLPYCKEILESVDVLDRPSFGWWLAVLGGMALLALIAWGWDILGLKWLFIASLIVHFAEAVYAFKKAAQAKVKMAKGWFWQTFLLGYPSLRLLLKRINQP